MAASQAAVLGCDVRVLEDEAAALAGAADVQDGAVEHEHALVGAEQAQGGAG